MIASLAAVLSLSLAAVTPKAPPARGDVSALVQRCVAAYGGKAALARAARSRVEGSVTSVVLHPGETGKIVRAFERPGRLRVEIAYPGDPPEARVLDGGRGWRNGEDATGPRLDAMVLHAARLDLPALLHASLAKLRDGGAAIVGGRRVRLLAVEPAPGLLVEAAIDPATGRILRSRGASTSGPTPLEFVTTYSQFEQVKGVLVPMREESWANGKSTGVTKVRKVTFPSAFLEGTFRP
ncbi:MAG TPA: hypothetical protein VFL83_17385 [Anaeromyxobacter sp.]|nr:hypothetical protein [Anaeromyxobacter sp.]